MGFINHLLRPVLRRSILVPAIRVRPAKVHRHTALSVDSAGLCAYIRRYHDFAVDAEREIIIDTVEIFLRPVFPYALFQTLHLINRKNVSFAPVPVKSDHDLFCKGTPDAENTFPENVFHVFIKKTKLSFVQIFPVEIRTAVNFFPFQCCLFHYCVPFQDESFSGRKRGRAQTGGIRMKRTGMRRSLSSVISFSKFCDSWAAKSAHEPSALHRSGHTVHVELL